MQGQEINQRGQNVGNLPRHSPQLIAEGIFKNLKASGLSDKDILQVSSEILGRLTSEMKDRSGVRN